uniref:Uncharacterized protein n=1 Tax=Opuntia streptacantha TaxID=393608 RepID=A0A7C9EVF7_OPUST
MSLDSIGSHHLQPQKSWIGLPIGSTSHAQSFTFFKFAENARNPPNNFRMEKTSRERAFAPNLNVLREAIRFDLKGRLDSFLPVCQSGYYIDNCSGPSIDAVYAARRAQSNGLCFIRSI